MRPDGKRVKDLPPIVAAIPYIMPKRYDAWNTITENIDEEIIKDFIRTLSEDTQIAIYNTSKGEWMVGCDCAYNTVGFWDWSDLSDELLVENVELHHDYDAGDGLWIDVAFDPRD